MRPTLYASFAVLGVLHLAASVPHGLMSHDTPAVLPGGSVTSPPGSSDDCRNSSSSASQKRSPQVIREKTVITIERTVQIEPLDDQEGCPCTSDQVRRCQASLNCEKKREADPSSPPPNAETQTSASTQTPTAPVTFTVTTAPEAQTTAATQRTTVPVTVPATTPEPQTTAATQRTTPVTVPATRPEPHTTTATQRTTVPVTAPTTTPEPQTTAATQKTTPVTVPATRREPQTTAATQRTTVPVTAPTTTPEPRTTARTPGPAVPTSVPTRTRKPLGPPPSKECNPDNCKPPNCTCMSTEPPGGLSVKDMPQFVMLTFDDAVTPNNMPFYRELLGDLKRKNKASGCRIAATFFASAEYLDYTSVNELYNGGNEIALHSISHKTGSDYWNSLNTSGWENEFVDQRRMMKLYANVPEEDVRGVRGPFFFTGADAGFRMLHRHFDYDCTLIHHRASPAEPPVFPYTMDFGFQMNCMVKKCPQEAYPGLWVMPLNMLLMGREMGGRDDYMQCAMIDACTPEPTTSNDTFHYLRSNFENFYNTNRAPMPVFVHEAWLKDAERKEGYLRFVDWLLEKEDVHLVTVSEVLDFMRYPKPKSSYVQRRCSKSPSQSTCMHKKACLFKETPLGAPRYMNICGTTCPKSYPWVGNPEGN